MAAHRIPIALTCACAPAFIAIADALKAAPKSFPLGPGFPPAAHTPVPPGPAFVNCAQAFDPGLANILTWEAPKIKRACGVEAPFLAVEDLVTPLNNYSKLNARKDRRLPIIMHIGANDFKYEGEYVYKLLVRKLKETQDKPWKLVLVEPISAFQPQIRQRALSVPEKQSNIKIVKAFISGTCAAKQQKVYYISPQLWQDYPKLHNLYDHSIGCSSFQKEKVPNCTFFHIRSFETYYSLKDDPINNMSAYVREDSVPCLEPKDLLQEVGAKPSDLTYLTVDAEGSDYGIIRSFLDIGARPPFLSFEGKFDDWQAPVSELKAAGYKIGAHLERSFGYKDFMAISPQVPL